MALRLLELVVSEEKKDQVYEILNEHVGSDVWDQRVSDQQILIKALVHAERAEALLDRLEKRFSAEEGFRIVLLPVEAVIPHPKAEEPAVPEAVAAPQRTFGRISREELYADIADSTRLTPVYFVMVVLSALVAAIGLVSNNLAVIIGAMVIAPLLGPNVALSLATTIGDIRLAQNALKTGLAGILTALVSSALLGLVLTVDPSTPEIASRTHVGLGDLALALASGSAGALAFTTGVSATLIGVMVAVALLPPVVTVGLLVGSGHALMAGEALVLFLTNLVCVNLTAVLTFRAQGIRPKTWWEADHAKRSTRIAVGLSMALLSALAVVILLAQRS